MLYTVCMSGEGRGREEDKFIIPVATFDFVTRRRPSSYWDTAWNAFASKVSHVGGYFLLYKAGRERKTTKAERGKQQRQRGRREGGRGGKWGRLQLCWMLMALSPTKMDTISFFPVMLAGYGSSQHCLHTLIYTIHTHALACSDIHTIHTCCAVSGIYWASLCMHFQPLSSVGERPI